ncbi:MAG: 5-oxoprolinase subunit PxpB [Pyrinomonadaceae bacterium]
MRIFPLGDSAATIEFGNEISIDSNNRSIALARSLSRHPFGGMIEAVPAYASVTVLYDPTITRFGAVRSIIENSVDTSDAFADKPSEIIEIPIEISGNRSPDLHRIAEYADLKEVEVLEIFLSQTYRVFMLGFLPGFAYMGEVDDRIAAPRLETPRTKVPMGSVGIAGKQTGIYPLESPGGWNIIGRTDLKLFDPTSDHPCLLKPGYEVRFVRC